MNKEEREKETSRIKYSNLPYWERIRKTREFGKNTGKIKIIFSILLGIVGGRFLVSILKSNKE